MSDTEEISPQATYRNNKINFKVNHPETPWRVDRCRFTLEDLSITDGQDPEGRIERGQERTWFGHSGHFNFDVGRKGSSTVANWWKANFKPDESTVDRYPEKLNFAFRGPLEIEVTEGGVTRTYQISTVGLGQGHSGTTNNWWIAAKGATLKLGNKITCEGVAADGEKLYFTFLRGGVGNPVDQVEITNINVTPF